jgi:very-short-patch-repair endonuclease
MKNPNPTSPKIRQRARELRRQMTPAEKLLWDRLRDRRLAGLKFRRQHPLGCFVADFYCAKHRLAIEIDGSSHQTWQEYDATRTSVIEEMGCRVIRFRNEQVLDDIESVLAAIEAACL